MTAIYRQVFTDKDTHSPVRGNKYYPLDHLAVIEVSGDDAGKFLQGQLTCNVYDLSETKANVGAFCTAKGRVISTLVIIKIEQRFLLLLPNSLLAKVISKLKMYVLRSKVTLADKSHDLKLIGLFSPDNPAGNTLPVTDYQIVYCAATCIIKLPSPSPRFLCLTDSNSLGDSIQTLHELGYQPGNPSEWHYQDISSGFPWFDETHSEQFIPQMLDIDRLGGISFDKGCYTGQEIIARTHYLGKSKRQLFLAECNRTFANDGSFAVLNSTTQDKCGDILSWQSFGGKTRLLLVLQTVDEGLKTLILDDNEQTPLTLIPYQ